MPSAATTCLNLSPNLPFRSWRVRAIADYEVRNAQPNPLTRILSLVAATLPHPGPERHSKPDLNRPLALLIRFALNAGTTVRMSGPRYVHAAVLQQFSSVCVRDERVPRNSNHWLSNSDRVGIMLTSSASFLCFGDSRPAPSRRFD